MSSFDAGVPRNALQKHRALAAAILAAGVLALLHNLWLHRFFYHDDALISLRYAMNFADLGDLSWNPGDRVEGYTNFLHLMAVSGLIELGIEPVAASRAVNMVGAALLLTGIALGLRSILPAGSAPLARATALAGALSAPSVAVWVLGGLETVPAAGFLALGVAASLSALSSDRPERLSPLLLGSIAFALAYLTRPDAVVMTFAAGLGILLLGRGSPGRRLVQCALTGAIPIAVIGLHLLWRLSYYDDVLPNTFYAKVGIDLAARLDGTIRYVAKAGLFAIPVVPIGTGIAIVATLLPARRAGIRRPVAFLLLCLSLHTLYVVWSGGDHMPAARVLTGLIGPGAMLLGLGLAALPASLTVPATTISVALMSATLLVQRGLPMNPAAYIGTIVGRHVSEAWPAGSRVALSTAGSTPFHAPANRYIDMLGLNDREIGKREDVPLRLERQSMPGHAKGDGASILARRPDYVILGPANGTRTDDPWFLSDLELAESDEFARCYEVREVDLARREDWPPGPAPFVPPLRFTYYERICPGSP